jgi:tRNA A37 threonylcarbamoyladenosine biosynthesis protein TsaE
LSSGGREDLFQKYNEKFADKVAPIVRNASRFVILGPPGSGKTFFIDNILKREIQNLNIKSVLELITGFSPEQVGQEYNTNEAEGAGSSRGKGKLKEMLVSVTRRILQPGEAIYEGFMGEEIELLKEHLPDKVPKKYLNGLKSLRNNYGPLIPYKIPWEVDAEGNVETAVKLIKQHFNEKNGSLPIRWLGKEYIPPGLVKEIVEKISKEGSNIAESLVKEQAGAYGKVVKLIVGDRDFEFEGFLALGIKDIVAELSADSLDRLAGIILSGVAGIAVPLGLTALVLVVVYALRDKERGFKELVELRVEWGKLSESLKESVASKIAVQLGITPHEALEAINGLLNVNEKGLRRIVDELYEKIEELEERVEAVERLQNVFRNPEDLNVVFEGDDIFIKPVKGSGVKYRFVNPASFDTIKGKAEELEKKVREVIERGRGVVTVYGTHGIGKSTLVRYILAKLLRDREMKAVIDLSSKGVNEIGTALSNAEGLNYIALYDPSSIKIYETSDTGEPLERVNPSIVTTIKEFSKKFKGQFVAPIPIIAVVPKAVYDSLDEETKGSVESVELSFSDRDFLKEIIRSYSGCGLDENILSNLASEVLKFNEGYTLIARLVGENLNKEGCNVSGIEGLSRESQGRAELFMVRWINDYLEIMNDNESNTRRIEAFSEILSIREAFKGGAENGEYVMAPYFVNRLAYWSNQLGLSGEEANWLALKHEDLLEEAISVIVRGVRGEKIEDEKLSNALSIWRDYRKEISINSWDDAVEHIFKEYGGKIKEEIAGNKGVVDQKSPCWSALILTLGATRGGHALQPALEAYEAYMEMNGERKLDLAEPVKRALDFLSDPRSECKALNLLLAGRKLTPLSRGFLSLPYSAKEFVDNPFLDVLIQRGEMRNELEGILRRWEDRPGTHLVEEIYALGLSVLSAYAKADFADEALRAAFWSIDTIELPDLVASAVDVLGLLSNKSPDRWAEVLSHAANMLSDNREALWIIGEFIINSLNDLDKLGVLGKVGLILAFAILISSGVLPPSEVCEKAKDLLKEAEVFNSELLRYNSEADVLYALAHRGLDCGINLAGKIEGLISNLDRAEKFDEWFNDENVREYLRSISLRQPKEALVFHIKSKLSNLYSAAGEISLHEGNLDDAAEYFERAKILSQEIGNWRNYVTSHGSIVRLKVLKADTLKGLVEVVGEFEKVFDEVMEKLGSDAWGNEIKGSELANYLVYLGLSGNKGETEKLLKERGWLLDYLPHDKRVAAMLFLSYLGVVRDRHSIDELRIAIYKFMGPALKLSLGLEVDCGKECWELYEGNPDKELALCIYICNMLHFALKGVSAARGRLIEVLKSVFNDSIVDELSEFGPKAVIQALSARSTIDGLILALNALLNADRETVRAVSKVNELWTTDIASEPFKALGEAVEKNDEEKVKLALAKLYYLYF